MTLAEKLQLIAENEQRVFDAGVEQGKQAEYDAFWHMILNNGKRTDFEYAFAYWGAEYIRPPMKIVPSNSRSIGMFKDNNSLKKVEAEYFDLSNCNVNDTSTTQGNYMTFARCQYIEEIEDIGMKAGYYYQTYAWCYRLKTIAVVRSNENTLYTDAFRGCDDLENITFEGTIGNNISFASSSKLSLASVSNIVLHLADFSATDTGASQGSYSHTLTLSLKAWNNIDSTEADSLFSIVDSKKWNLSTV